MHHGLPHSLYTYCHSVFWTDREPTLQEQLINKKPTTEVGRALEELGVTLILTPFPPGQGQNRATVEHFSRPAGQ